MESILSSNIYSGTRLEITTHLNEQLVQSISNNIFFRTNCYYVLVFQKPKLGRKKVKTN